jgi:hypothetical protein
VATTCMHAPREEKAATGVEEETERNYQ